MNTPLISVICLSWNHEDYISKCLYSVINQTYSNIEIIYLDNASTDKSFEIANDILSNSKINYISKIFEENIGCPKAFNYALENLVNGSYISIISTDDWLETDNFLLKYKYSIENPNFGLIYSTGYNYHQNDQSICEINLYNYKEGDIFLDLLKCNFVHTMGVLIKKEVFDNLGYFNENNSIEDWEFVLRVSRYYNIGFLNKPLFYYRKHSTNYSIGSYKYYTDAFNVILDYKNFPEYKIGYNWLLFGLLNFIKNKSFSFQDVIFIIKITKLRIINRTNFIFLVKLFLNKNLNFLRNFKSKLY